MIRRSQKGWCVDVQPGGRGHRRYRKIFSTKPEAKRFEAFVIQSHNDGQPWAEKNDKRFLSELIEIWYAEHGKSLRDGGRRKRDLDGLCMEMRSPRAIKAAAEFQRWRSSHIGKKSPVTLNLKHAYLKAVFGELIRLGHWRQGNPLATVRRLKTPKRELSYLTDEQVIALLTEADKGRNPDTGKVARVCLATGARWAEAESILAHHVKKDRLQLVSTKNGKPRTIPIDRCIRAQFHGQPGRQFKSCYSAFRDAVDRVDIVLPRGQLTHVLRHTFASNYLHKGGDILELQRLLDHESIETAMRYAHLRPDYMQQVKRLNPLSIG